jgi:hypothetical protein
LVEARARLEHLMVRAPDERRLLMLLGAAALAVLAARLALVAPTFLHANFHGRPIVDSILDYPAFQMGRQETFGQFGFIALNAIARVFGRRFEVLVVANQVFAALTLFAIAWTTYRWTRRAHAALFAMAAGALHVAVARVAGSEDAHNLAVLLGWIALLTMDVFAERKSRLALAAATVSLALMIHTRQTMYVFLPCAYGLALARDRSAWRRPELWASALVIAGVLFARARGTFTSSSEQTSFVVIGMILATPRLLGDILVHHPFADVVRFGPFPTLLLACGAVVAWRRGGVERAVVGACALCFVTSVATPWHTPGVEYAFRLPAMSLALALAGIGGAWIAERLRARAVRATLAAAVALAPLGTRSARELRAQSADFLEYAFVRAHTSELPRAAALVELARDPRRPSYSPPYGLLHRAGVVIARDDGHHAPRLFLAGVQCWGWSMGELLGIGDDPRAVTHEQLATWGPVAVDGALERLTIPRTMRPDCARLLEHARPLGTRGEVAHPTQDIPFVLYGVEAVPIQWYELD